MFLAIIFLVFAMYKMQDTMLLWIHAKYGIRIPTKNCMVGNNDKLFDAYFSYCLKDDQVVSQIARELHDYRLCLHQQNLLGRILLLDDCLRFQHKMKRDLLDKR